MKFSSTVLIASAVAVASAASSSTSVALTPQASCLATCSSGDVNCQADCVGVPHPNNAGVNDTTECATNCDQGDGTPAQTEEYAQCLNKCYSAYYLTTGGAAPTLATIPAGVTTSAGSAASNAASATGAAASGSSGSGSGSGSNSKSSTAGSSGSSTASGSAASASSSTGVAPYIQVGTSAVGLVGLVIGIFAL